MDPSEDDDQDKTLPRFERDRAASELFPLDVRTELDELADALGCVKIEDVREAWLVAFGAREIVQLALAGELIPFAGRDAAGKNVIDITASQNNMRMLF